MFGLRGLSSNQAQKRIQKLRSEIARLRNAYHVENAPSVTDDVYDSLTRELKELLKKYPDFEDANAGENRVAGKALEKFVKVKHKTRMLSLNDVFSEEELFDWEKSGRAYMDGEAFRKIRTQITSQMRKTTSGECGISDRRRRA